MSDGELDSRDRQALKRWKIPGQKKLTMSNLIRLLDLIERNCRWPDFCIDYELAVDDCDDIVVRMYYSTGGWSGHEELISELEGTWFWMFCWVQSRRGGHYIFEIKPEQWK